MLGYIYRSQRLPIILNLEEWVRGGGGAFGALQPASKIRRRSRELRCDKDVKLK